jgi:hypothetical protein
MFSDKRCEKLHHRPLVGLRVTSYSLQGVDAPRAWYRACHCPAGRLRPPGNSHARTGAKDRSAPKKSTTVPSLRRSRTCSHTTLSHSHPSEAAAEGSPQCSTPLFAS